MVIIVAKGVLNDPRSLDEKPDLVLISHADAAMHLDSLIGRPLGHFT